jgi:glycosyltransferase involved in cell wall biosynthesis
VKVAHLDTGRTWRGGQNQVLLLARGLAARGVAQTLFAPDGPLLERARALGLATVRWRPRGEWDVASGWTLRGALRRARPDVVHAHSAHAHAVGVPAARAAGVPAVVVSRRVDFAVGGHALSRLKYGWPDAYLCISRGVMAAMRRGGVPERKLLLVPSGVPRPVTGAPADDLFATLGIGPEQPVVGTVAALAPHKDHATLMQAARRVIDARPEVAFVWLGEGECRPALERQRRALQLERHVHMPGFRADALAFVPRFTVFALASWLEGLGTSLLDAQWLGVPVVATAVGGIPDVIDDGVTGRLVPPRDPDAMARALLEALGDPTRRTAWAARAREAVAAFSDEAMVTRTLAAYREVLERRTSAAATRA